ncbi:DMT family transporter [Ferruginivarius sediminum]|nr:DMT family transporter [Ferruginivarius sediminum]
MNEVRTADYAFGLVTLAGAGFGLNPLFARALYAEGLSPELAVFVRFAPMSVVLLPVLPALLRQWRLALVGLAAGAAMAVGTLAYFHALTVLPVSLAALIYFTYPLFTILIGWLALGRPMTRESTVAAALVLAACALVVSPRGLDAAQLRAVALCFLSPLGFALIIHALSTWLTPMPLWSRMCAGIWGHMLVLVPAMIFMAEGPFLPRGPQGWSALVGLATVAALLPQIAFSVAAPHAGPERTAIGGSAELLTSLAVGWVALEEAVQPQAVAGATLLMAALFIARRQR